MRLNRTLALGASLLVLLGACTAGGGSKPTIKIGSDGFYEAKLMAEIYGQALEANGYTVDRTGIGIGARKVSAAALESGQFDLKPEYIGSGLAYYEPGKQTGDPKANQTALQNVLNGKGGGITVLDYSPAADQNAFVVRKETADQFHLAKMSDLTAVQSQLKFGVATDCPTNPVCGTALKTAYGLDLSKATLLAACDTPMAEALLGQDHRRRRAVLDPARHRSQRLGRPPGRQADPAGRQHRAARPQRLPRQGRQDRLREDPQRRVRQDGHRDLDGSRKAGVGRQEGHRRGRQGVAPGERLREVAGPRPAHSEPSAIGRGLVDSRQPRRHGARRLQAATAPRVMYPPGRWYRSWSPGLVSGTRQAGGKSVCPDRWPSGPLDRADPCTFSRLHLRSRPWHEPQPVYTTRLAGRCHRIGSRVAYDPPGG